MNADELGEFPDRQDGLEYAPKRAVERIVDNANQVVLGRLASPEPDDGELILGLRKQAEAAADPLRALALSLRKLTLEHITTMCKAMGKPEMRDTLVQWAISYLDGTEMP